MSTYEFIASVSQLVMLRGTLSFDCSTSFIYLFACAGRTYTTQPPHYTLQHTAHHTPHYTLHNATLHYTALRNFTPSPTSNTKLDLHLHLHLHLHITYTYTNTDIPRYALCCTIYSILLHLHLHCTALRDRRHNTTLHTLRRGMLHYIHNTNYMTATLPPPYTTLP